MGMLSCAFLGLGLKWDPHLGVICPFCQECLGMSIGENGTVNLFGGMATFLWHQVFFFFFFFHKSGVMCFVSNHSITFNIKSLCHEVLDAIEAYIFSDVLL